MGRNRADFLLMGGGQECLLETKSVTLVEQGVALFPDAPTIRGRIHLEHLIAARRRGLGAGILFVIRRSDAEGFAPNWGADPEFGEAVRRASRARACRGSGLPRDSQESPARHAGPHSDRPPYAPGS